MAQITFRKADLATAECQELLVLLDRITASGVVTDAGVTELREWLGRSAVVLPAVTYLRESLASTPSSGEVYRAIERIMPADMRSAAAVRRQLVTDAQRRAKREVREEAERRKPIVDVEFPVAGVKHEGRAGTVRRFARVGLRVLLAREPNNAYSRNAIAVLLENGKQIGYVPEESAGDWAPLLDAQCPQRATVAKIWGAPDGTPIPIVSLEIFNRGVELERVPPVIQAPRAERAAPAFVEIGLVVLAVLLVIAWFMS